MAFVNIATVHLGAGDPARARQALEAALALNPRVARAHNALGVLAAESGHASEAVEHWKSALELEPRDLDTLYNLGRVPWDEGHRAEARPYLERFVREASPPSMRRTSPRSGAGSRRARTSSSPPVPLDSVGSRRISRSRLPDPPKPPLIPFVDSLLLAAASLSLVAVLALRLYAAFWAVPIQTPWDDALIRRDARIVAGKESTARLLVNALTPGAPPLLAGRVNGYGNWAALGQKLRERAGSPEVQRAFQLVNVAFFCVQCATVLLFGYWSTRDAPIAVVVAFLYASSPIVFGISRWVLTENLVLTAGPALALLAASLLSARARTERGTLRRAVLVAGLTAYLMGLLGSAREYAAPSYGLILLVVVTSLLAQKRLAEAATFAAVIACFVVPLAVPLGSALRVTLAKADVSSYFHPLWQWVPHVAAFVVGPSLTLAFLALLATVGGRAVHSVAGGRLRRRLSANGPGLRLSRELRSGVGALYWSHWLLLALYVAGIVWSRNRSVRAAILPMLVTFNLVLLYFRRHPSSRRWLRTAAGPTGRPLPRRLLLERPRLPAPHRFRRGSDLRARRVPPRVLQLPASHPAAREGRRTRVLRHLPLRPPVAAITSAAQGADLVVLLEEAHAVEREIVLYGVVGVEPPQPFRDVRGHGPACRLVAGQANATRDREDVSVEGNHERPGLDHRPHAEVDGVAPHHPTQEEVQALAGAAVRR